MSGILKIGILTTLYDKLLPFLIKEIFSIKKIKLYLILAESFDEKKENMIFKERTNDFFTKQTNNIFKSKVVIESFFVSSHNSEKCKKIIEMYEIDYLYNSSTPNKIKNTVIKKTKGVINIHPGILPMYRGCTCPEWTLYNNDPLGCTAHLMNSSYDSGPIMEIKYLKFNSKDIKSYADIRILIYLLSIKLCKLVLQKLIEKKISFVLQNEKVAKYHKVIPKKKLDLIKQQIKKGKYKFNLKNISSK